MTMCQECLALVGDGDVSRMPWGFRWFGWDLVKPDGVPQHALVSPVVLFSMPVELCQMDRRFKELAQMAWLEQEDKEHAIAEAVAAEREACCTLDPPPLTDEQEDEWLYKHNGRYADAFWDGWEAYRASIRARAGEGDDGA